MEGLACADPGARAPIGASGIFQGTHGELNSILLSIYISAPFKRSEKAKNGCGEEINGYFVNPSKSLMKTLIMRFTGEIEFEGIACSGQPFE